MRLPIPIIAAALTIPHASFSLANDAPGERLEAVRAQHYVPALTAYGVRWDGQASSSLGPWAVGERAVGSGVAPTADDLWHIGSCTKAFTATLLATYVAEGTLDWGDTLAEALPDLAEEMSEGSASATIAELLRHRAGLPSDPPLVVIVRLREEEAQSGREAAILYAFANAGNKPSDGEPSQYSNLGYMVAGVIAERLGGKPWEELVVERVLTPLGIEEGDFGFGPPPAGNDADSPKHPVGHAPLLNRTLEPRFPGGLADNPSAYGPAGTLHLTMEAWGRFCMAHARGDDLEDGARDALGLSREDYAEMHRPVETFAAGWLVARRSWARGVDAPSEPETPENPEETAETGGVVLTHNGSNTLWFATVWIAPERDAAMLAATNAATPMAAVACDQAVGVVLTEFAGSK